MSFEDLARDELNPFISKLRSVVRDKRHIESAYVDSEPVEIGGYTYKSQSPIYFYSSGNVKCGIFNLPTVIGKIEFSNEVPVFFS